MPEPIVFDANSDTEFPPGLREGLEQPIAILLGAVASIEAGIPASFGMTKELVQAINEDTRAVWSKQSWALNFICGALQAHATALNESSYDEGLDIEYVASDVALLATRQKHEAAPFVQQWNPAIQEIETPSAPTFLENTFTNALSASAQP